jgi:glutathione synthase/RimK-type ligase-like ATP-grasp enzyme
MQNKIALVSYHQQKKHTIGITESEDELLLAFLNKNGLTVEIAVWNDPNVDWKQYDVAIIKSPWDYHDHIDEFYRWLKATDAGGTRILNSPEKIVWNSNKKYLLKIAEAGLPVIPTQLIARGANPDWNSFFDAWEINQIVVKPCVSAGAKNTILLKTNEVEEKSIELKELLSNEDFLVQPYLKEVEQGEWSLIFLGGRFSHSVLKVPKSGDFRVQQNHGGSSIHAIVDESYISKAQAYVQNFAEQSLYVRVDGIIKENEFYLMELEMIEPYLFLSLVENGYENYYKALINLLNADQPISTTGTMELNS